MFQDIQRGFVVTEPEVYVHEGAKRREVQWVGGERLRDALPRLREVVLSVDGIVPKHVHHRQVDVEYGASIAGAGVRLCVGVRKAGWVEMARGLICTSEVAKGLCGVLLGGESGLWCQRR